MVRQGLRVRIPNPHQGDINQNLLERILQQARISRDEWEMWAHPGEGIYNEAVEMFMNWTNLLRSQQADFIQKLESGSLLHCEIQVQHRELIVISAERLKQLRFHVQQLLLKLCYVKKAVH